ncbi:shikimate kinase [Sulfitobacter sp.]|uniref:shikimate kinase n=1 Tax=Sulfitobacter sp. TaxID=1903071 RepID=UPI00329A0A9F
MSEIDTTTANIRRSNGSFRLKKTVALVGMMGAGKTAVGRAVALRLGAPFLDSDAEIEAAANLSVPEIFQRDGEAFFRKRETEVIRRLMETQRVILSTGGGAFLAPANRETIADKGVAVWLDAPLELLWSRVRHKDTRPLLRTQNPRATLAGIFEARTPVYKLAELHVKCAASLSIEAMAERVVDVLLTRPDVLEKIDG